MKNNENSDAIQKENRKNWLKFAVTLVVCALGGAVLGYGAAWFSDNVSLDALADSAGRVAGACAPFAVLAAALFLIPAAVSGGGAKPCAPAGTARTRMPPNKWRGC